MQEIINEAEMTDCKEGRKTGKSRSENSRVLQAPRECASISETAPCPTHLQTNLRAAKAPVHETTSGSRENVHGLGRLMAQEAMEEGLQGHRFHSCSEPLAKIKPK